MKNLSRSNSSKKLTSCFRPVVDLDAMLEPPSSSLHHRSSSSRMASLPLPPKHQPSVDHHPTKPTFSLLIKALAVQTCLNIRARPPNRHRSKRRSSGDERPMLNQATKASHIPETKAEPPSSCSSSGSESENSSKSFYNDDPEDKESRREEKSEKQKKSEEWSGIFMVVFSLTFTVTVGKYWGALLTSTWLYFFSLAKAGKEKAKLSRRQVQVKKNRFVTVGEGWWGHKGTLNF